MTQEEKAKEKELLLDVLCDGLPYGLQVEITDVNEFTFNGELRVLSRNWCRLNILDPIKKAKVKNQTIPLNYIYIKPYLRPMSSMTEEEQKEYHKTFRAEPYGNGYVYVESVKSFDWLNAHHFDYRGLIDKGLAIEVTEDNDPYKD